MSHVFATHDVMHVLIDMAIVMVVNVFSHIMDAKFE